LCLGYCPTAIAGSSSFPAPRIRFALAINRQLFWRVTRAFLTMQTPIAT
jgi:hypothetical protein